MELNKGSVDKIHKIQNDHWKKYYQNGGAPMEPSTFAIYSLDYLLNGRLKKDDKLIEFGCGNGRDASYFAQHDLDVFAVDLSSEIISELATRFKDLPNIDFINSDFTRLEENDSLNSMQFSYVYSRFTLHAITEEDADRSLKWANKNLNSEGLLFIEARSVQSSLYGKGEPVGRDEFILGHYRRFIRRDEILKKLASLDFEILYETERDGLAIYKDDDPVVIRVIAQKK